MKREGKRFFCGYSVISRPRAFEWYVVKHSERPVVYLKKTSSFKKMGLENHHHSLRKFSEEPFISHESNRLILVTSLVSKKLYFLQMGHRNGFAKDILES